MKGPQPPPVFYGPPFFPPPDFPPGAPPPFPPPAYPYGGWVPPPPIFYPPGTPAIPARKPWMFITGFVVAIVLVPTFALLAVLSATPFEGGNDVVDSPGTVELQPQMWEAGSLIVVVRFAPAEPPISVDSLMFFLASVNGTSMYAGPAGTWQENAGTNTTVFYIDNTGHGIVTARDVIRITPLPSVDPLRGAVMRVESSGRELAVVRLPS